MRYDFQYLTPHDHEISPTTEHQSLNISYVGSAPGGDLQTIIDDNLVPFEADVVKFVRQLVEGLAYLHERKIAHLDIKVHDDSVPTCTTKLTRKQNQKCALLQAVHRLFSKFVNCGFENLVHLIKDEAFILTVSAVLARLTVRKKKRKMIKSSALISWFSATAHIGTQQN